MSEGTSPTTQPETPATDVTVLGWVVPRAIGRWHQSIVVTSLHVWVLPEMTFAQNEKMAAAAAGGLEDFHNYLKQTGWIARPDRCNLSEVRGVDWNETTGWMRIAGAGDLIIGAMIPNRSAGGTIKANLKRAIGDRVASKK